jgi:hypothetical protein
MRVRHSRVQTNAPTGNDWLSTPVAASALFHGGWVLSLTGSGKVRKLPEGQRRDVTGQCRGTTLKRGDIQPVTLLARQTSDGGNRGKELCPVTSGWPRAEDWD